LFGEILKLFGKKENQRITKDELMTALRKLPYTGLGNP
jgi:hypothetical protein